MKNIELGIFIVSIGLLWLLEEVGIIRWSVIRHMWVIWPALLILIGINIIFKGVPYIRIITWLLFLAAILVYGFYFRGAVRIPINGYEETVNMINMYRLFV